MKKIQIEYYPFKDNFDKKLMGKMSYKQHNIFGERKQFQIERMILFSDAVFAIAITLLIIELKLPEIHEASASAFLHALAQIGYKFIGFIFSFFLIGVYWIVHHRLFGYVINYNNKLIWLNLLLLFFIVTMPFTTAVAFETATWPDYPFTLYSLNHIMIGLFFYRLWSYIGNPKHKLSQGLENKKILNYYKYRSLATILTFLLVLILGFIYPIAGRFAPSLLFFAINFVNKKYRFKNIQ